MEFTFVPAGTYRLGKTQEASLLFTDQYDYYTYLEDKRISTEGFYISRTLLHLSHWKHILQSKYSKEIKKLIPEEELEAYQYNYIRELSYGIHRGWRKVLKDKIEEDPILTFSYDLAHLFAKQFGLKLPSAEEWEIALRGEKSYLYPDSDTLDKFEFTIETYPYSYYWEDPESTMGYRDSGTVKGNKNRIISFGKYEGFISKNGLQDLFIYGGEWNYLEEAGIYRSISDVGNASSGWNLSDDPYESEALHRTNHRAFSLPPLFAYSTTRNYRVAGFRLLIPYKKELTRNIIKEEAGPKTDWKLYAFLGEPIDRVLEYLGKEEYQDSFDASTGASVSYSCTYYYYKKGMVLEANVRFGKMFRASPSAKVLRFQKLILKSFQARRLEEKHHFDPYQVEVFPGIKIGETITKKQIKKKEKLEKKYGLTLMLIVKDEILSEVHIHPDYKNLEKLNRLKYREKTLEKEQIQILEQKNLSGHQSQINGLLELKDKKLLISISFDSSICLWDMDTNKLIKKIEHKEYHAPYTCISHSCKENEILLGDKKGNVEIFQILNETFTTFSIHKDEVFQIIPLSEKRICSSSKDSTIQVYDLDSKQLIYSFQGNYIYDNYPFAVNKSQQDLFCSSTAKIYCLNSGKVKEEFESIIPAYGIKSLEYFSNQNYLLIGYDSKFIVLELDTKKIILEYKYPGFSFGRGLILSLIKGNSEILLAGNNLLEFRDTKTAELILGFKKFPTIAVAALYSEWKEKIYAGSYDGSILVMNPETERLEHRLGGQKSLIYSVAVMENEILSGDSEGYVFFWDKNTLEQKRIESYHTSSITSIQISHDKKILSTAWDGRIRIWKDNQLIWEYKDRDWIVSCAYTNKENSILYSTKEGKIACLDIQTKKVLYSWNIGRKEYSENFQGLCISTDKEFFAYWNEKEIYIHSVADVYTKDTLSLKEAVRALSFSSDDNILIGAGYRGELYRIDIKTKQIQTFRQAEMDEISHILINKSYMLCTGKEEALSIWDHKNMQYLGSVKNHSGGISPACFITDDAFVVAGSAGTLRTFKITRYT